MPISRRERGAEWARLLGGGAGLIRQVRLAEGEVEMGLARVVTIPRLLEHEGGGVEPEAAGRSVSPAVRVAGQVPGARTN